MPLKPSTAGTIEEIRFSALLVKTIVSPATHLPLDLQPDIPIMTGAIFFVNLHPVVISERNQNHTLRIK
jgi:hypothetical protein